MPAKPLNGIILIGWMERDEAVRTLHDDCFFDPPLSDETAEALWKPYRQRVEGLNRAIDPCKKIPRNKWSQTEKDVADSFEAAIGLKALKVCSDSLIVHQLSVVLDKVNAYKAQHGSHAKWIKDCLPTTNPEKPIRINSDPVTRDFVVELPHGECMLGLQPDGNFRVVQGGRHITVSEIAGRLVLTAGYHRSYGLASIAPEGIERSMLVAFASTAPLSPSQATLVSGLRPPLFRDFFDEDFFITVKLRRKRYEMRVSAHLVAVEDL
jgi:hypothetical protein